MKSPSWFVSFQGQEEIERNVAIDAFVLSLCCQLVKKDHLAHV